MSGGAHRSDDRHASTIGLCVSPRLGQYDVTVLHRPVIALQHDRPRLLFIAVERPARDPGNGGATNNLMAVEHEGDDPPDQRDVRWEERRVGKECSSRWAQYH